LPSIAPPPGFPAADRDVNAVEGFSTERGANAAEAHELAGLLIPEPEGERLEAREQRERFDLGKQCVCFMAPLQIVIGDPRAQMMNVMKADIAGEPLKNPRKFVERTSLQSGVGITPRIAALPIGALELVLYVE
jgi:hypothetical protein